MNRFLKVGRQIRKRKPRGKQVSIMVPALSLSGEWLRLAGFTTSSKVQVTVYKGRLVIDLIE